MSSLDRPRRHDAPRRQRVRRRAVGRTLEGAERGHVVRGRGGDVGLDCGEERGIPLRMGREPAVRELLERARGLGDLRRRRRIPQRPLGVGHLRGERRRDRRAGDGVVVVVGAAVVGATVVAAAVVLAAVVVEPPPVLAAPLLVSSPDPPQPATSNATKMGSKLGAPPEPKRGTRVRRPHLRRAGRSRRDHVAPARGAQRAHVPHVRGARGRGAHHDRAVPRDHGG